MSKELPSRPAAGIAKGSVMTREIKVPFTFDPLAHRVGLLLGSMSLLCSALSLLSPILLSSTRNLASWKWHSKRMPMPTSFNTRSLKGRTLSMQAK